MTTGAVTPPPPWEARAGRAGRLPVPERRKDRAMAEVSSRFRRRADEFEAAIKGVAPDRWDVPTPCEKWRAKDIVCHVVEFGEVVIGLRAREEGPTRPAAEGLDPLAAFRALRS